MKLTDAGIEELVDGLKDGALPSLKVLKFTGNRIGEESINSLCDAFGRGVAPKLETLILGANSLGDAGAKQVAAAFKAGRLPKDLAMLVLAANDIGNEGAISIATALHESGSGCRVNCMLNLIGLAGESALLQALEARHGTSPAHLVALIANAPVLLPAFLIRGLSRGIRIRIENSASERSVAGGG